MSGYIDLARYEWFLFNRKAKWFVYAGIFFLVLLWLGYQVFELSITDRVVYGGYSLKQLLFAVACLFIILPLLYEFSDNVLRGYKRVKEYQARFPLKNLGKQYELFDVYMETNNNAEFPFGKGRLYLVDKVNGNLHWIANYRTCEDLLWVNCWRSILWEDLMKKKLCMGEDIITRGEKCR